MQQGPVHSTLEIHLRLENQSLLQACEFSPSISANNVLSFNQVTWFKQSSYLRNERASDETIEENLVSRVSGTDMSGNLNPANLWLVRNSFI